MIEKFCSKSIYKSVVCLNGQLPKKEFFGATTLPIIAVDGATKLLYEIGIEPQMIIGDLDSSDPSHFPHTQRVFMPDQNSSDFEKAMSYLAGINLIPAIVTGMSGGYLDHVLYNMVVFSKTDSIFYTDSQIGMVITGEVNYELPLGTKVSILGFPRAALSSNGLKWELENYQSELWGQNSCFNRTVKDQVTINVSSGGALVIIYTTEVSDAGLSL
jgi:thiamine pyrophosphokinase